MKKLQRVSAALATAGLAVTGVIANAAAADPARKFLYTAETN